MQFAQYGLDRVAGVESEEQGIAKDLESPEGQEVQIKLVAACAKHRSFEDSIGAAKRKKLETDRRNPSAASAPVSSISQLLWNDRLCDSGGAQVVE